MDKLLLYTQPGCPQCRAIKMMLDKADLSYETTENIEELNAYNIRQTPALKINNADPIVGKDIVNYIKEHKSEEHW